KPEWKMWQDFQHHRAAALRLDALQHTHPIHTEVRTPAEATENFDLITYEKGASVVRMIERYLGPSVFRKGVRAYIRRHREGNAVAADLWRALAEAAGEPVAPIVPAWIEQEGLPVHPTGVTRRGAPGRAQRGAAAPGALSRAARPQPAPRRRRRLADPVGGTRGRGARAHAPRARAGARRERARRPGPRRAALRLRQRRRGRLLPAAARRGRAARARRAPGRAHAGGAHGPARPPVGAGARRPRAARRLPRARRAARRGARGRRADGRPRTARLPRGSPRARARRARRRALPRPRGPDLRAGAHRARLGPGPARAGRHARASR